MEDTKKLRTYAAELPCTLTDMELMAMGQTLAHRRGEFEALKLRKAEEAALLNAEIKATEATISVTAKAIRDKSELRSVDVDVVAHFAINATQHIRQDTGAVIKVDALRNEDRQDLLFDAKADPADDEEDLDDEPAERGH